MCMVQNESEHLLPATYRQQRCWRITGDCSVFFPYFVFAGDFLEGGGGRRERRKAGGRRERRKALAMGRRGRKKALAMGREVERKK